SKLGAEGGYNFKGILDEISIYPTALAASDIATLYGAPPPQPANLPPVWSAIGNPSVTAGQPLTFTVLATDPEGAPETYSTSALPAGATFTASTRTFSWTPSLTQTGSYNLTVSASDGTLTANQT